MDTYRGGAGMSAHPHLCMMFGLYNKTFKGLFGWAIVFSMAPFDFYYCRMYIKIFLSLYNVTQNVTIKRNKT